MSKDLGKSTSYAYYVDAGGTKTPQEYGEMLVNIDTVATRAEDAADSAAESATGALNSKNAAQTAATTATNKASEATTAATTATTKAGEASTSASTATSAKDTAVSAASTATTKATEATTAAATATSAATTATTAKDDAVSAKTAAQTAQTGAETAAASVAESAEQIATNAADISQLKSDLTQRVSYEKSDNLFNPDAVNTGRLNGNWGNILSWSDFEYSEYIKTDATTIYFSSCPYEVCFYNNGSRVGIYTGSQMVADENGWYKTPTFTTIHDGFAFDYSTMQSATYYIDKTSLMVATENLGVEFVPFANYPKLYGKRAALYDDIPTIPPVPTFVAGSTNYFVGTNAGENTTEATTGDEGKYNTGIGVKAMQSNTTGDHCTAVGFQAMQKNTTGDGNTAFGEDALYENLTGSSNVAVGSHALQRATGSGSVAVGSSALISQSTGYYNTAVGIQAGRNFGTAENAITTDDRMTLIGGYANKKVSTSLTNSTVIGFQAQADKSNQVVIGNEDVTEIVLGPYVLSFNQDGTVTWTVRT